MADLASADPAGRTALAIPAAANDKPARTARECNARAPSMRTLRADGGFGPVVPGRMSG